MMVKGGGERPLPYFWRYMEYKIIYWMLLIAIFTRIVGLGTVFTKLDKTIKSEKTWGPTEIVSELTVRALTVIAL